jgi:predicted membrane-bound spermidine synthase
LAGAGIWSVGLAVFSRLILKFFVPLPPGTASPLISLVLLAPPAFLLGAIPPAVLRLAVKDVAKSGQVAGFLSAIGTLGSLLGTYLTGYILLPRYAVTDLLYGTAAALILLALALASVATRKKLFFSAFGIGVIAVPLSSVKAPPQEKLFPSAYGYVVTKNIIYNGQGARALFINQGLHAAALPTSPEKSVLDYARGFSAADAVKPNPERMLTLGGGGFHVARDFITRHPSSTVDVVEIDPAVVKAAASTFGSFSDSRINLTLEDARSALPKLTPGYDLLIQDAYAGDLSVPWYLITREAFAGYRRLLKPDGVFMANIIMEDGNAGAAGKRYQADFTATIRTAFRWAVAISMMNAMDPTHPSNVIVFAGNGPEPDHALVLSAVRRELGKDRPREIQLIAGGRVWTDDLGPADYESLAMYGEAYRVKR